MLPPKTNTQAGNKRHCLVPTSTRTPTGPRRKRRRHSDSSPGCPSTRMATQWSSTGAIELGLARHSTCKRLCSNGTSYQAYISFQGQHIRPGQKCTNSTSNNSDGELKWSHHQLLGSRPVLPTSHDNCGQAEQRLGDGCGSSPGNNQIIFANAFLSSSCP